MNNVMKRFGRSAAIALAAGSLAACGGGDEAGGASASASAGGAEVTAQSGTNAVVNTYLTEMGRIGDALATVTDDASAARAASTIREASDRLNRLADDLDADAEHQQIMAVFAANQSEFIAAQQKIGAEMTRLAMEDPSLLQSLSEAMDELPDLNR